MDVENKEVSEYEHSWWKYSILSRIIVAWNWYIPVQMLLQLAIIPVKGPAMGIMLYYSHIYNCHTFKVCCRRDFSRIRWKYLNAIPLVAGELIEVSNDCFVDKSSLLQQCRKASTSCLLCYSRLQCCKTEFAWKCFLLSPFLSSDCFSVFRLHLSSVAE